MTTVEPKTLKGFKDYSPSEAQLRQKIIDICRRVFELYGFLPLETPALEYAEILEQKYGEDEKLIYKFEDRGGRMVGLRYDLTVPLARYVAENLNNIRLPFRRYAIGSAWRAENPQKGRFREFVQADADIVGVDSLSADAECIALLSEVYETLGKSIGLGDYEILINTREIFNALGEKLGVSSEQLREIVRIVDKLDKIGLDKVTTLFSEMGLNDSQLAALQGFVALFKEDGQLAAAEKFFAGSETGKTATGKLREIEKYLKAFKVKKYRVDLSIARGLDYYTGTVYEVRLKDAAVGSVGGGGRYDGLVEQFLSRKIPAVGASVGVDRLLSVLLEKAVNQAAGSQVLVMNLGQEFSDKALEVLNTLRQTGVNAQYFYDAKDLDKQFKFAESLGVKYAVIVGEQEIKDNIVQVKDLKTREQQTIKVDSLPDFIKNKE